MSYAGRKPSFLQTRTTELAVPRGTDVATAGTLTALDVSGNSNIRLTNASAVAGLVAPAAPVTSGKILYLTNASANPLFVNDEDVSATAGNRIVTGTSAPIQVGPGATVMLQYDDAASRWRILGGFGSGSGGGYFRNYLELYFSSDVTPTVNNGGVSASGTRSAGDAVWASPNTANFSFQRTATNPLRGLYSYVTTGSASGSAAFIESPTFVLDLADSQTSNTGRHLTVLADMGLPATGTFEIAIVIYATGGSFLSETLYGSISNGDVTRFPVALTQSLSDWINSGYKAALRIRRTSGTSQLTFDRLAVTPDQILTNDRQQIAGQKVFYRGVQTLNSPSLPGNDVLDVIPVGETRMAGRLVVPAARTVQVLGDLNVVGAITGTGTLSGTGTITSN